MTKGTFCDKNLESMKIGLAIGFSLSGITILITGAILNLINPSMCYLSILLAMQGILIGVIRKEPRSLEMLKQTMKNVLNQQDDTDVNTFIDDMVSTHTKNTARVINEPIVNQITERTERTENNNKRVHMNAYYDEVNDTYYITPRVVYK